MQIFDKKPVKIKIDYFCQSMPLRHAGSLVPAAL